MHIAVTGGADFIGSHLTAALLARRYAVSVVDDLSAGHADAIPPGASLYQCDLRSQALFPLWEQLRPDAVIHCAAQISVATSLATPLVDLQQNAAGTVNLLEACRVFGTKRIIYTSSAAVYCVPEHLPIREDYPLAPLSPYGLSKLTGEWYTRLLGEQYSMCWAILRYANVFGPRQAATGDGAVVPALRLGLTAAAFIAAAALPLGVGRLAGLPWHRSFANVASQIGSLEPAHGLARVWTGNPALNLGLLLGLTLLVAGGILLRRGDRERSSLLLSLGVLLLVLFTQAYGATGIPVLMDPGRSGLFFSLFLALAIGITVELLWQLKPLPTVWQTACACGLILLQVRVWRPTLAHPLGEYEYAEAANAYLAISRGFAPVAWTIVAPQEQYDEALGIGLHEHSYYFATAHTPAQMRDPSFQLVDWPRPDGPAVSPTEDIFVFVEKQPLGSPLSVTPDAVAAVPGGLTPDQVHDLIYASPAKCGRLQARIWGLMAAYRTAHPEQVTLYRDGAHLRVDQIHRILAERPR